MTRSKLLPEAPLLKIDGKSTRAKYLKKECELVKWKEKKSPRGYSEVVERESFCGQQIMLIKVRSHYRAAHC